MVPTFYYLLENVKCLALDCKKYLNTSTLVLNLINTRRRKGSNNERKLESLLCASSDKIVGGLWTGFFVLLGTDFNDSLPQFLMCNHGTYSGPELHGVRKKGSIKNIAAT